jgi:hypothetical protein
MYFIENHCGCLSANVSLRPPGGIECDESITPDVESKQLDDGTGDTLVPVVDVPTDF